VFRALTCVPPSSQASDIAKRIYKLNEEWATNPRWTGVKRSYDADHLVRLQGSRAPEDWAYAKGQANKLWDVLTSHKGNQTSSVTFGALDPAQAVQMAKYADTIYVSGWQCAVTASTSGESGPDLADYPYDTVPTKVDQLTRALRYHDRKQWAKLCGGGEPTQPTTDYHTPIIADGDTGHGGISTVMKLTKLFVEAGSAGIHFEDQRPGSKKCGHMGGKVLVSTQEHEDRLKAARLQADVMGANTLLVARTDAESATLLDSNIDPRDHAHMLGTAPGTEDLVTMKEAAEAQNPELLNGTFWKLYSGQMSHQKIRNFVALNVRGGEVLWEYARTEEGFYRIRPSVQLCIERERAYAPYADVLWMETAKPGLGQAREFASGINSDASSFGKLLAYNLSPSFNWDDSGMSDGEIRDFCHDLGLGPQGFQWLFITLAGFHGSGLVADRLGRSYIKNKDMLAYVRDIQRAEREEGVELLTHQTWSGAELLDLELNTVKGQCASDTAILGSGNTESQFK
jgi:isocitrate lyase